MIPCPSSLFVYSAYSVVPFSSTSPAIFFVLGCSVIPPLPSERTIRRYFLPSSRCISPFTRHDSFNLQLRIMTEVHQQSQLEAGCFQVILNLRTMFVRQFSDCFQFEDDLIETNKIGPINAAKREALVRKR